MAIVGEVKTLLTGDASGLQRATQQASADMVRFVRDTLAIAGATATASEKATLAGKAFEQAFGKGAPFVDAYQRALGNVVEKTEQVSRTSQVATGHIHSFGTGVASVARHVASLTLALAGFTSARAIARATQDVFLFNSEMEQAQLATAATLTTAGHMTDSFGRVLPLAEQLAMALREGGDASRRLLADSVELGVPVQVLVHSYGLMAGAARAAKISQEQLIPIVEGLVVIGDRLQIPQSLMARDIDNIVTGLNVQRTVLGTVLRITEAQVKEAREQGRLGEFLLEKLQGALGSAQLNLGTWQGITNAIRNAMRELALGVGSGAFESMKGAATGVLQAIKGITENPARLKQVRDDLGAITDAVLFLGKLALSPIVITVRIAGALSDTLRAALKAVGLVTTASPEQVAASAATIKTGLTETLAVVPGLITAGKQSPERNEFVRGKLDAFAKLAADALVSAENMLANATDFEAGYAAVEIRQLADELRGKIKTGQEQLIGFVASATEKADGAGHARADKLPAALQARATAELQARRDELDVRKRSAELQVELAEADARYADSIDQRESSRIGRAERLFALRQHTLAIERQELDVVLTAARERVNLAQQAVFAAKDRPGAERATAELTKALSEADKAGAAVEDWHTRAAIAVREHQIEVASLRDEYLHLGDIISSSLTDVVKGIALGTGSLKDAGRRMGEAIMGAMIQATIEKKLANFDPMIKKNLLDLGTEGGRGLGANLMGSLLGLFGAGAGTGAGAAVQTSDTVGGIDLAVPNAKQRGGGGLLSLLAGAGAGYGIGSIGAGIFGAKGYESTGAGIGGAVGMLAGGPLGALAGALAGGLLGSLFNASPTKEHINLDSVRDWVRKAGVTQAQGTLGGRSAWGDHSIISRVFPGMTDTGPLQGLGNAILAIGTAGLGNDKGQAGDFVNAFVNNQQLLRHSVERSRADLLKLAETAGVTLEGALSKLEEQLNAGTLSADAFRRSAAELTGLFEKLPAAIDIGVLALEALDKEGSVTFEHLQRVVADLQSTIGTGLPAAFETLVQTGSAAKAGKTLAEQFGETFVKRVGERLLEGTLATQLSQAVADAEKAAELYAAGDVAGANALMAQARGEFLAGRSKYLAGISPVAQSVRKWERSLGIGSTGTIIDETGMTMLSYDTPTFTRVPGPYGRGMPAIVHGGETVRSPQQEDRVLGLLGQIVSALDGGLRGNVNNDLTIRVQLDSRDIAYGQERLRVRGGMPGVITVQPTGRRG